MFNNGCGNDIFWILILLCCCGNGKNGNDCGCYERKSCGCDCCDLLIWYLIISCVCGCGSNKDCCCK